MPDSPSRQAADSAQPTRPYIGGQAVLEGVMMRAPTSFAVVVRRSDGSLHVRERAMVDGRVGVAKMPLARGVASLVESLRLGMEALRFSAEQMERDDEAAEKAKSAKPKGGGGVSVGLLSALRAVGYTLFLLNSTDPMSDGVARKEEKKTERGLMTFMVVLMVGFLIALPQAATAGLNKALKLHLEVQSPAFQAMTGAFKLTIVVGWLLLQRRSAQLRRVFQYHGAEHKTISTYEANEPLTVANARAKTTLHPRCGTTFLVMVALVSILVFTAVGGFLPRIDTGKAWLDNLVFFVEKLPFLPVIAAVTFEIQRVFARYCTTGPLRVLLWPGFLCQKITTIEPDDAQLEVALASLRVTLFREEGAGEAKEAPVPASATVPVDVRYASFDALMKSPRLRRAA